MAAAAIVCLLLRLSNRPCLDLAHPWTVASACQRYSKPSLQRHSTTMLSAAHILSESKRFQSDKEVTGTSVWAAAPALLQWLNADGNERLYRSKRVLELGAGTGYLGINLAKLGASQVVLTDLPQQCGLIDRNLELNECASPAYTFRALPWGMLANSEMVGGHKLDLVVAADVAWADDLLEPLAATTAGLLHDAEICAPDACAIFALTRHRAHHHVPDHAHNLVYDLLQTRHGLHVALVGSVKEPAIELGAEYFSGAASAEGAMPIDIFKISSQSQTVFSAFA